MRRVKLLSFFLAAVLSMVLISSGSGAALAASHTASSQTLVDWQSLVKRADPYVHIVNHVAVIDSQIGEHLSADDVSQVEKAINFYNSLPLTTRQHPHASGTLSPRSGEGYQWYYNVYWWGVRIWINTVAAQNFGIFIGAAGGAIGAAVGGIIGATGGAIIGGIVGGVSGYITSIYDTQCGNRGVFIDVPWIFTDAHATPVC